MQLIQLNQLGLRFGGRWVRKGEPIGPVVPDFSLLFITQPMLFNGAYMTFHPVWDDTMVWNDNHIWID